VRTKSDIFRYSFIISAICNYKIIDSIFLFIKFFNKFSDCKIECRFLKIEMLNRQVVGCAIIKSNI
jgi:hypothetical protein